MSYTISARVFLLCLIPVLCQDKPNEYLKLEVYRCA